MTGPPVPQPALQAWPWAEQHEDLCRVLLWQWRIGHPADANHHERFPCTCTPARPWTMREIEHPAWCVLELAHPWHECALAHLVPRDKD